MGEYNFLNDITKFGNNALSAANTLQRQVRAWVTEQVEYLIKSMELITKDELNDALEAQNKKIEALEKKIAGLEGNTDSRAEPKKPAAAKPAIAKPAPKKKVAAKPAPKKKAAAKKATTKTAKA